MIPNYYPEDPGHYSVDPLLAKMEPFPIEHLPVPIRDYVVAHARSLDCDPTWIALPVLSALAASIGGSRQIRVKKKWTEPAVLWTAVVGKRRNQPALEAATFPLQARQQQAFPQHEQWLPQFQKMSVRYKKMMKHFNGFGHLPKKPIAPVVERFVLSDWQLPSVLKTLAQSCWKKWGFMGQQVLNDPFELAELARENAAPEPPVGRGVLLCVDQLDDWLGPASRIGKRRSTELSTWLKLHAARAIDVNPGRNQPPLQVANPAISITGSLLPDTLVEKLTHSKNPCGLVSRLLLAMPPALPRKWTDDEVEDEVVDAYTNIINKLLELKPDQIPQEGLLPDHIVNPDEYVHDEPADEEAPSSVGWVESSRPTNGSVEPSISPAQNRHDANPNPETLSTEGLPSSLVTHISSLPSRPVPATITLSPEARALFADFNDASAIQQSEQDEALTEWLAHNINHAARLALVIHLARWAAGDEVDATVCDEGSMLAGVTLAHWFAKEAVRTLMHLTVCAHQREQNELIQWVLSRGGVVSARNLYRVKNRKYPTAESAEKALHELHEEGVGCWVLHPAGAEGGRPYKCLSLGRDFDKGLPRIDPTTLTPIADEEPMFGAGLPTPPTPPKPPTEGLPPTPTRSATEGDNCSPTSPKSGLQSSPRNVSEGCVSTKNDNAPSSLVTHISSLDSSLEGCVSTKTQTPPSLPRGSNGLCAPAGAHQQHCAPAGAHQQHCATSEATRCNLNNKPAQSAPKTRTAEDPEKVRLFFEHMIRREQEINERLAREVVSHKRKNSNNTT